MDPISQAIDRFRGEIRAALARPGVRVIRVVCEPGDSPVVARALRAEEWHQDNRSPYLLFDIAHTTDAETLPPMAAQIRAHYDRLAASLAEDDIAVPAFDAPAFDAADPVGSLATHIHAFSRGMPGVLTAPLVAWIPTNVTSAQAWVDTSFGLLRALWPTGVKFVFRDEGEGLLERALEGAADAAVTVRFRMDDKAILAFFRKLASPPSAGRAAGTLPGAAAPDVVPPVRPGPKPATGEELRAVLAKEGLPPALAQDEAERLRHLVLTAAEAVGNGDERTAIATQAAAAELCMKAGVRIEESLMIMLLGSYCLHFDRLHDAEIAWRRAEKVAGDAAAFAQVAQIRLALAHLLLRTQKVEEAAAMYEQAGYAARVAGSALLWIEALRLAGTCHVQRGSEEDAYHCWNAVVRRTADEASGAEIGASTFMDVASDLLELLRRHGMDDQARSVVQLIRKAGAKTSAGAAA